MPRITRAALKMAVDEEDELDFKFLPCACVAHICGPMHYTIDVYCCKNCVYHHNYSSTIKMCATGGSGPILLSRFQRFITDEASAVIHKVVQDKLGIDKYYCL